MNEKKIFVKYSFLADCLMQRIIIYIHEQVKILFFQGILDNYFFSRDCIDKVSIANLINNYINFLKDGNLVRSRSFSV